MSQEEQEQEEPQKIFGLKIFQTQHFCLTKKKFQTQKFFSDTNLFLSSKFLYDKIFGPKMNF